MCIKLSVYISNPTNMFLYYFFTFIIAFNTVTLDACIVRVNTDAGAVCGLTERYDNVTYAIFRNVPYAKQPLGKLRFKELQPAEPWKGDYDATVQGPICHQKNKLFNKMVQNRKMSEACIHANIYTPTEALSRKIKPEYSGLPVLVFTHGGAFQSGSGDADIIGPEYLFSKNIVVVTFNYRINLFGYLSLDSPSTPGNQALRDAVTLLRWVQKNVRAFGGNPKDVTLMGQSSGACNVHLLSLSPVAKGLFHKTILLSGTSITGFYSPSHQYAKDISSLFLAQLGLNSTNPEYIHAQLIKMPIEKLMKAYYTVQDAGIVAFTAVIESKFDGVTQIVDGDPDELVKSGRGSDIPMIIGFDTSECFFFERRFTELGVVGLVEADNSLILSPKLVYTLPKETAKDYGEKVVKRYSHGNITMNSFLNSCTDTFFVYPSMKLAQWRAKIGGETYLYQFSYEAEYKRMAKLLNLNYNGTTHVEDLTYIFRPNHLFDQDDTPVPKKDDLMRFWMTDFISNFTRCGNPTCACEDELTEWPAVDEETLKYQDIRAPQVYSYKELTPDQSDMISFFDSIQN